ncbi:MAG: exosortase system-associated protein, TIGR04073 family [Myxococcota bacterium]
MRNLICSWPRQAAPGILLGLLLVAGPAVAQETPDVDARKPTGIEKPLTKLGRGLANAGFGWMEIFYSIYTASFEDRSFGYMACVAPLLGGARFLQRTTVGALEVLTFPISWGGRDYGPLIEPEFVP